MMALLIGLSFQAPLQPPLPWFLGLIITTFLTLTSAMGLGLLVSALAKNSAQANAALPILLLPQIIFSGVLFKLDGAGQYLSWLTVSRWSVGAYGALADLNSLIPAPIVLPDGSTLAAPIQATPIYESTWSNLLLNWEILSLQLLIYLSLIVVVKKQADII